MEEDKRIIDPISVEFDDDGDKGFVNVFDGHQTTSYNLDEYEVKVVVEVSKRIVPINPIKVGTIVRYSKGDHLGLIGHYIKMSDGWWWLGGRWPQKAQAQDDSYYRLNTVPVRDGEW